MKLFLDTLTLSCWLSKKKPSLSASPKYCGDDRGTGPPGHRNPVHSTPYRMYITRDRRTSFYRVCARGSSHLTFKKVHIISGRPMTHTQSSFLCCTRSHNFLIYFLTHIQHSNMLHTAHVFTEIYHCESDPQQGGGKFDHLIEHFPLLVISPGLAEWSNYLPCTYPGAQAGKPERLNCKRQESMISIEEAGRRRSRLHSLQRGNLAVSQFVRRSLRHSRSVARNVSHLTDNSGLVFLGLDGVGHRFFSK